MVNFSTHNSRNMNGIETGTVMALKVWFFSAYFFFLEYFGIPKEPFSLLGFLMLIDMATWVFKAARLWGWKAITSNNFWWGLVRKIFTLVGICAIAIGIKGMGFDGGFFLSICLSAFIAAETYSIVQNAYIINSGKQVTEWDATALIFKAISEFFKRILEHKIESILKVEDTKKEDPNQP